MKLKPEQLARHLKSEDVAVYWLAGDEPLLMQEAADRIRASMRKKGFSEREVFTVERGFEWQQFHNAAGNMSLFAERKLIELRFATNKFDDQAKDALIGFAGDPGPDCALLITSPKLESSTPNTKWFKQIETAGAFVQIWPVNRDGLHPWLEQRLLQEGIRADSAAMQILMDKIEGNLLAAMQEIEKLKLLANTKSDSPISLDAKTVMQVVADSSRFNVYQLVDAALSGDLPRSERILQSLRAEAVPPLLALGAITRELRSLQPMLQAKAEGKGTNAILQSARVWFNRKQAVGAALNRLSLDQTWRLLNDAREVDLCVKGLRAGDPWIGISRLLASLSGKRAFSE